MKQLEVTLTLVVLAAQARLHSARDRVAATISTEEGMTTETVIITALLAALAIAIGTIITLKVVNKANGINLG